MGARQKPVVLDGRVYSSKKELLSAIRTYVGEAPIHTPLRDSLPYAILDRHPHCVEKIGVGLRHIELRLTEYKNRGFYLVRTDGTDIDFSWRVALGFAHSGPTLAAAAREAVSAQIAAVPGTGHVHHDGLKFRDILGGWLATLGWRIPELIHGDLRDYFADPADEASWQDYHRRRAVLRRVSVEEHKRIHGRKGL